MVGAFLGHRRGSLKSETAFLLPIAGKGEYDATICANGGD